MRPDDDLLTPLEAADYLRVHRDTLYLYIKHGIVPARKIGDAGESL